MKATTELAQALYEVRLAGNPGPIEAAEALRQAINNSFDAAAARRENLTQEEVDRYAQAMEAFTIACRRDLSYQPSWWQVWRPNWWRARRRSAKERRSGPPASVATGSGRLIQVAGPMAQDVVFGTQDTCNTISGTVIGTVMGSVVQAGDIQNIVFSDLPADEVVLKRDED